MSESTPTQWEQTLQKFSRTTDRLGMPIDAKILDTVVALNLLDIHTKQSCEGHLDHSVPAPWVTFTTPGVDEAYDAAIKAHKQAREESEKNTCTYEEQVLLFAPAHALRKKAEAMHAVSQQKMIDYLAQFYENRHGSYHRMLVTYSRMPGVSVLESMGAKLQIIQLPAVKQERILEYQQEMADFTAFLKTVLPVA